MPLFFFSGSQRFEKGLIKGDEVWANNSGPALFRWRYIPLRTDTPPAGILCFYEENNIQHNVISREEGKDPVPLNNIPNTDLRGKVVGYVDPTDPTIFGFRITEVSKSIPMEYGCTASYNTPLSTVPLSEPSPKLSLQVLGNYFVSDLNVSWNFFI